MNSSKKFCFALLIICFIKCSYSALPIVMWHGMGDTCCFPFSLGSIKKLLQEKIENVYVKSLKIGGCLVEDYESGFFVHPNKQVEEVCHQLANDKELENGYNAIGFSQGGQFLRAVAQRCPHPPMKNLISLGGQHQGVFGLPYCPSLSRKSCDYIRKLLNHAVYESWVQKELVQATYWHDPYNEELYKNKSTFLSDINNEVSKKEEYSNNLQQLERFVMVKFLNDTIVQPKESQWFEFYAPGQDVAIVPLRESKIYVEDRIGLKQLDLNGKLVLLATEGNHLQFTAQWFEDHIIPILN